MGWPEPSHCVSQPCSSLEGIFGPHLDDAMSLLLLSDAEVRIVRLQRVLVVTEVEIAAIK